MDPFHYCFMLIFLLEMKNNYVYDYVYNDNNCIQML